MKAMSLRMSMQTLSPGLTPSEWRPAAMRSARPATSSWLRRRLPLMMPWKREVIVAFRFSRRVLLRLALPRFRKARRTLLHVGAHGLGLVGTAQQLLLLDGFSQQCG